MPDSAPYIVGLTGGIGSGKSTVGALFAGYGIAVVDTDRIAHQLTGADGKAMPAIRDIFGDEFITKEQALDRAAMRRKVFADPNARQRLEAILHPMIHHECDQACRAAVSPYVLLMVPLLIESGNWRKYCQRVLVVDCREETQIARVVARNGFSIEQVRAIMDIQASREERLAAADDVIDNDGVSESLPAQVERLHFLYLERAVDSLTRKRCGISPSPSSPISPLNGADSGRPV